MRRNTDSERIDIDFKGTEEMQRRRIRAAAGTAMRMTIKEPIVYVVDDDASVRVALDNLVRPVGFRVQTFATAQDFLQHKPARASLHAWSELLARPGCACRSLPFIRSLKRLRLTLGWSGDIFSAELPYRIRSGNS